jgi:hypothetical protein
MIQATSVGLALSAVMVAAVSAGCGAAHQSAPDVAPADAHPGTHAGAIQMPDGFRNVAFSCHGSVGVYVTSYGLNDSSGRVSGIAVLKDDPNCAG